MLHLARRKRSTAPDKAQGTYVDRNELIALQAKAQALKLVSHYPLNHFLTGTHAARAFGRGLEFEEVRTYQVGDDLNTIDWRVTARTGKLHTKVFKVDRERPIVLCIDLRASMWFGTRTCFKSVLAARLASLFAWCAQTQNEPLAALILNTDCKSLPVGRSQAHVMQLLNMLSNAQALNPTESNMTLPNLLAKLKPLAQPGSTVIYISDFSDWDDACYKQFQAARQYYQLIPCFIYDNLEKNLPHVSHRLTLTDDTHTLQLNAANKSARENYATRFMTHYMQVKQACESLHLSLYEYATHEALTHAKHLG